MELMNKILPIPFLPIGLTMLFILAGMVTQRRLLTGLGVLVLWIFSMPVVSDFMMEAVEGSDESVSISEFQRADAIVVLSGEHLAERYDGGIDLFKAGRAPVIVFTRGVDPSEPNVLSQGEILRQQAVDQGISPSAIRLTGIVTNTRDEAVAAGKVLGVDSAARKKIILVTSAVHMHRAALLFEKAGFSVECYPVDFRRIEIGNMTVLNYLPDAEFLSQSSTAMRELIGWFFYWIRG
jgi:uncharacterized SAM-binding protein YcdF (DUF218 family)